MSAAEQPGGWDALTRLESELISIAGLADCLVLIGISRSNDPAFGYLGSQLTSHHDAARKAFDEVFEAAMKQKPVPTGGGACVHQLVRPVVPG